ncbi:RAPGEF1 [Lepeophtheirus salmonis]|uniref:CRK SH3-binding GNRP n=1 Tax=Lepeophtheirus salmonis TaxID=72036 RepID=A0A7R8CGE2_LEPSM|nr:RAPGEF1 [Lepeophtheirus salmonis]CAF2815394.1 RAPGEF1 [Lepeophtheirus salmonis]
MSPSKKMQVPEKSNQDLRNGHILYVYVTFGNYNAIKSSRKLKEICKSRYGISKDIERLEHSIYEDCNNPTCLTQLHILAVIGKLLTGKWMKKFYNSYDNQLNNLNAIYIVKEVEPIGSVGEQGVKKKKRIICGGSSDNILEYERDILCPDIKKGYLMHEMELALDYFEEAVIKRRFELLPGCANVVLETLLSIQKLVGNEKLVRVFKELASLTLWADSILLGYRSIESWEKRVSHPNVMSRKWSSLKKSSSFHNSLPDMLSEVPPPLPPKLKHRSFTPQIDWFSNPLFQSPQIISNQFIGCDRLNLIQNETSIDINSFGIEDRLSLPFMLGTSTCIASNCNINFYPSLNVFKSKSVLRAAQEHTHPDNIILCSRKKSMSKNQNDDSVHEELNSITTLPPPLPPKKNHIMTYMEIFGKSVFPSGEFIKHGLSRTEDILQKVWQENYHDYSIDYSSSSISSGIFLNFPTYNVVLFSKLAHNDCPPILPPKKKSTLPNFVGSTNNLTQQSSITKSNFPLSRDHSYLSELSSDKSENNRSSTSPETMSSLSNGTIGFASGSFKVKKKSIGVHINSVADTNESSYMENNSLLDILDVTQSDYLIYYNGNEVRAGIVDALVVLATQNLENLIKEMLQIIKEQQKSAFSLMVRVVDCLADCDFQDVEVMELLTKFMSELVSDGELMLSRALRSKFIQRYDKHRAKVTPELDVLPSIRSKSKTFNILNFKSTDLAEQMTYLDYQLFIRLDTVELILWVQEQNEDKSYNLTKFTEHFNNMSFWCRTQILQQDDSKEREKYMTKFIKIMKFLRKYNNFNSYLAILSALDSAPIRRLEWHKNIIDNLKEYCSLIDSSSSFRAYRQALNESGSPCIPYVGLILQDLTFVHIGNSDIYHGKINFAKRWQQFNILDNLRRFRKENYHFKRREDIISFFDGFSLYLSEDELWQLSESIKPRCSNYPKVNKQ